MPLYHEGPDAHSPPYCRPPLSSRTTATVSIGPRTVVHLDDLCWLRYTIGGDHLDRAISDVRNVEDLSRR
eukprot:2648022-Pyramimonas_sp.AAC.1